METLAGSSWWHRRGGLEWVDGEKGFGFGRRFGVNLHLDGDSSWFILVALSVLSLGLEHSERQMLKPNSRRLSGPKHKGMG
jgi:hypothetical protein